MNYYKGSAVMASLCAGPLFIVTLALGLMVETPKPVTADAIASLVALPIAAIPVVLVGFLLAIIPTAIGTRLLYAIGSHNDGVKLPVAWGLSGGLMGRCCAMLFAAPPVIAFTLAATGALCALLCRRNVVWP